MSRNHLQVIDAPSPPAPGRTVHLPERGSFFVRVSDGPEGAPAVVLLHGLAATADLNWSTTLPALSREFRVVAPDLRGHGRATTEPGRFTLEAAADDVAALADALSLGPFIVVGYSMGGAIAQLLCKRHPERVRGLVLCATSRSFVESLRERLMFATVPALRAAARVLPGDIARAGARGVAGVLVGEHRDVRGIDADMRYFDVGNVLDALNALGAYRSDGWIGAVDVPSAVLVHLRDQLVPPDRQFALSHALPSARVHPVDSDHFAAVKKPQAFVSTLVAAVRDVDRRSCRPDLGRVPVPASRAV